MKVLITGATGFVGSALVPELRAAGHHVIRLVRRNQESDSDVLWDPAAGKLDPTAIEGVDAAVHLAGETIAGSRWSESVKRRILESRVKGTLLLAETLARLRKPPKVLVSASAIGFYGDRGDEILTEDSVRGDGFLADVCVAWEKAAAPAAAKGIRTVLLRIGIVLSPNGGALRRILPPFRMGLGGVIGDGRQYWSWISIDDLIGVILHAIETPTLNGPVNAVSPESVTNAQFTKILGRALKRPTIFPLPAFAARLILGEMADALLLSSARVEPKRLKKSGYLFKHSELKTFFVNFLKKVVNKSL